MTYKIDATAKILGRLATEIAVILRGKNLANFTLNRKPSIKVEISNVGKIRVSGDKEKSKLYWHYSGYPGGIYKTNYADLKRQNHSLILKKAVYGMLPKNRLRAKMMKNLIVK